MPLGFELTIFIYAMAWALFWMIRPAHTQWALRFLAAFNLSVIFCANALLCMYLVLQIMLICALYFSRPLLPAAWRGNLPWFAFLGLIPLNVQAYWGTQLDLAAYLYPWSSIGLPNVFWYLGASFFVIKSFVVLKEAFRQSHFDFLATINSLTFVPAFPAGPICGSQPFSATCISPRLERKEVITSLAQLGWGGAAFYVLAPKLRKLAERLPDDFLGNIGEVYLGLGALYFDFSGYSLMAIAAAAMFGVKLPANFNRPYLATSIREFWQRWHMSLNWFVGTYLFKPFVRNTGLPRVGIFLAFVLVGIWHKFSLGYLLWGVGHGIALSLAMRPPLPWRRASELLPVKVMRFAGWFLTISWVALLSWTANVLLKV